MFTFLGLEKSVNNSSWGCKIKYLLIW